MTAADLRAMLNWLANLAAHDYTQHGDVNRALIMELYTVTKAMYFDQLKAEGK